MAAGKTHTRTQVETAAIYAPIVFSIWAIYDFSIWAIWGGIILGIFITPDLDVDHGKVDGFHLIRGKSPVLAWLWRMYWFPYAKFFSHGNSSHWLIIGTLIRFTYFFIPFILLGCREWQILAMVFVGLCIADFNHVIMDLPTGTSRLMEILLVIGHFSAAVLMWKFLIQP